MRTLIRRLLASRRAQLAVTSNAMTSIASLVLSVAIARVSTIVEFGNFALAMIVYVFVAGAVRAAFTDTALSRPNDPGARVRSFRRAALAGVLGACGLIAIGLAFDNAYFVILGAALHGLLTLDFLRTYDSAIDDAGRAVWLGAGWSAISTAVAAVSVAVPLPPMVVMGVWAGVGALSGYVGMILTRMPWLPAWPKAPVETSAASFFAVDYLVGSGGSALTTALAGGLAGAPVAGALRGAGTILGPVSLLASTARSLTIPLLARAQDRPATEWRVAGQVTIGLTVLLLPPLVALQFLPDDWGRWLLGDTWAIASAVLLPIALESLFAVIGGVPAAGHRAAFAGRRAVLLRAAVGVPRPFIVVGCALAWGALGAAWSMAAIAVINAVIWWISYSYLVKRPRPLVF